MVALRVFNLSNPFASFPFVPDVVGLRFPGPDSAAIDKLQSRWAVDSGQTPAHDNNAETQRPCPPVNYRP